MLVVRTLLFLLMVSIGASCYGVTLCAGSCDLEDIGGLTREPPAGRDEPLGRGSGAIILQNPVDLVGHLYLDYSVFSASEELSISVGTSLVAETITIYQYSDTPEYPDSYLTYVLDSEPLIFNGTGNWVIFGERPVSGGVFEATGNLYIGNYSALSPVPTPSSLVLILGGLVFHFRIGAKRLNNK